MNPHSFGGDSACMFGEVVCDQDMLNIVFVFSTISFGALCDDFIDSDR